MFYLATDKIDLLSNYTVHTSVCNSSHTICARDMNDRSLWLDEAWYYFKQSDLKLSPSGQ